MSYADAAAKGPKQSDADKIPPHVSELLHDDSGVHSLDSLHSSDAHVQSLSSADASAAASFSEQELTAERAEQARRDGERFADDLARETNQFVSRVENEAGLLGGSESSTTKTTTTTTTAARFEQAEREARKEFEEFKREAGVGAEKAKKEFAEFKREAGVGAEKAKKEVRKAERWAEKNQGNPVVLGNAVVLTALAGVLGFGAYRMNQNQSLTWRVVGVWAGAVGLFAVGDYFVSSYLFKKYPPKK